MTWAEVIEIYGQGEINLYLLQSIVLLNGINALGFIRVED